jgi:hypothetical protein
MAASTASGDRRGCALRPWGLACSWRWSHFGCISSTILYAARIYLPMAQDGVFLPALARIHPRYQTPAACIVAQGLWSIVLTFSGSYEQLYTYVVFAVVFFHVLTGAAVFVLAKRAPAPTLPDLGLPLDPLRRSPPGLVVNTLSRSPESLIGFQQVASAYHFWRRKARGLGPGKPLAAGGALARETMVIITPFLQLLLCLFPLLLVVVALSAVSGRRAGTALLLVLHSDPVRAGRSLSASRGKPPRA